MATMDSLYQMETLNIEGIWVDKEQKWYPLNINFSVVDGVLQGQYGISDRSIGETRPQC